MQYNLFITERGHNIAANDKYDYRPIVIAIPVGDPTNELLSIILYNAIQLYTSNK
ncbi:hypothetical protein [Gracilibacillus saliphilus]|uniref:hypothetical protein n=1 Tax=Gracilibacillus saliphilus TaxID=543890 RepID=UPI0013D1496F|nr:hypothetical protein [Gracilibacillus saliphilus]